MRVTLNCKRRNSISITGWIASTFPSFLLCRHCSKERLLTSISCCRASVSSFIYPYISCPVPLGTVVTGVRSPDTPHPDTIPPACLWTLSSFAAWLDHQPCKEDLWPWSTQNDICWGLGNHGERESSGLSLWWCGGVNITRKYLQISTHVSSETHRVWVIWPPKYETPGSMMNLQPCLAQGHRIPPQTPPVSTFS